MENSKIDYVALFEKAKKQKNQREMEKDHFTWEYGKSGEIKAKENTRKEIAKDVFEKLDGKIKGLTLEIVENTLDLKTSYISKNNALFKDIENILHENKEKYFEKEKIEK